MDFGIKGKTALVLGAGGGLGSAVALALAQEGVKIAAVDINQDALDAIKIKLDLAGASSCVRIWNLAEIEKIDEHLEAIQAELGPIDILFNNTGGPAPSLATAVDASVLRTQFDAMVVSVMAITSRVTEGMRKRNWGRVITSTSSGVVSPIPNLAISNSLRLALVGWSKTLSRELAPDGVTVNVVVPGRIATARVQFLDDAKAKREGSTREAIAADSMAAIPMGRYGTSEEFANTVAFLASERASYITGSQIRVDGGLLGNI